MERSLEFINYRNLGLDKPQRLVLNYSLELGKLGGLITVIGPNNAGKSNVLDGLINFKNGSFEKRDITLLEMDEKYQNPTLKFVAKDGDDYYEYGFNKNNRISKFEGKIKEKKITKKDLHNYAIELLAVFKSVLSDVSFENKIKAFIEDAKVGKAEATEEEFDKLVEATKRRFANYGYNFKKHVFGTSLEKSKYVETSNDDKTLGTFLKNYGFNLIPHVFKYDQVAIKSSELSISPYDLENSKFFKSVLKAIDYDYKTVLNAYKKFEETGVKGILDKVSKELNKKMSMISNRFNTLYRCDTSKYLFDIELESSKIFFKISKDEDALMLAYQSTGFRWFFDFYFNFLLSNSLVAGDIVVSDEFATCLHPQGQKELRKFIKEFGQKNDIIFVIATQSPFLSDVDNFDELRVVSSDKYAHISNSFTTVNHNDPDSLKPIKESFTISNHVLYDYDTEVVFVEGITDYNYLTMFKRILGYEKIAFLPIEGLGKTKSEMEKIRNTLISIRKNHGLLLTDGDGAGKEMINVCKGTALDAISLIDVDPSFKEIENLFSEDDQKKHGIKLSNKTICNSCIVKNFVTSKSFSDITLKNFKKLFETLTNR